MNHSSDILWRLRANGVDPYPYRSMMSHTIAQIRTSPTILGTLVTAGRVASMRVMGRVSFVDLVDAGERLQAYLTLDALQDQYEQFLKFVGISDFIEVAGTLFYTKKGELTLKASRFALLSKALATVPSSYYGVRDTEVRYRQRYLDLTINQHSRKTFVLRSKIISQIRRSLELRGFLEVETPIIQECYGGADARPFFTEVRALNETRFLRISPELYLKRLIVGGLNKVFEIGKDFRNEDIDTRHNPEFTMLELYEAYSDYNGMMSLTEELVSDVAREVLKTNTVRVGAHTIDFAPPWRRLTVNEAIAQYANLQVGELSDAEVVSIASELDSELTPSISRGIAIATIFDKLCQSQLVQPTFVIDYPRETTPLCKPHRQDPSLIERFELFVTGMEIANAYTELNDPVLQARLLQEQRMNSKLVYPYDEDFIQALEYGMPPTGGLGIGIDRLAMVLTGNTSIKDVILFPMMRNKKTESAGTEPPVSLGPEDRPSAEDVLL